MTQFTDIFKVKASGMAALGCNQVMYEDRHLEC